jgi:hypothetical protein
MIPKPPEAFGLIVATSNDGSASAAIGFGFVIGAAAAEVSCAVSEVPVKTANAAIHTMNVFIARLVNLVSQISFVTQ